MKHILVIGFAFSVIFPIVLHGLYSPDMRDFKIYESYADSSGEIQQREKEQVMYPKSSGVYSQYWQFWGLRQGITRWFKFSLFCYFMVIPFLMALSCCIKASKN